MAKIIRAPNIQSTSRTVGHPSRKNDMVKEAASEPPEIESLEPVSLHLPKDEIITEEILSNSESEKDGHLTASMLAVKAANDRAEKAENQLVELRDTINDEMDAARKKGYLEGHNEGFAKSCDSLSELISLMSDACAEIKLLKDKYKEEIEDVFVEVVFASVSKILIAKSIDKTDVQAVVTEISQKYYDDANDMVLRLNPEEYKSLVSVVSSEDANYRMVPDDRVKYGGYIIGSNNGSLDARLNIQMENFLESLLRARSKQEIA